METTERVDYQNSRDFCNKEIIKRAHRELGVKAVLETLINNCVAARQHAQKMKTLLPHDKRYAAAFEKNKKQIVILRAAAIQIESLGK